jgi:hypothetical protein
MIDPGAALNRISPAAAGCPTKAKAAIVTAANRFERELIGDLLVAFLSSPIGTSWRLQ